MNWVVIVAGGSASRMQSSVNKIFIRIYRKPVLYWTLLPFQNNKNINKIIISVKPEELNLVKKIVKKYHFTKVVGYSFAGQTRQETVLNSLKYLKDKAKFTDMVGIHNAANPLVRQEEITQVYKDAYQFKAALLARLSTDTIKLTDSDNFVNQSPKRDVCFCAQTPQVARFDLLYDSYQKACSQNLSVTDDSQVLESNGISPKITLCSPQNFKITYPQDIFLAKQILKIRYNL